jgi:hypothetical protein
MSEFIEMIPGCGRTSLTCETCAADRARETAVSALQARQVHLDWMGEPADWQPGPGWLGTDRTRAARGQALHSFGGSQREEGRDTEGAKFNNRRTALMSGRVCVCATVL